MKEHAVMKAVAARGLGSAPSALPVFVLMVMVALALAGCNPWGEFNNPADIGSPFFQGFEVAQTAEGIKSYSPAEGSSLATGAVEFVVSLVTGAQGYRLQISESADFTGTVFFDKDDFKTNRMTVTALELARGGKLFWRAKAKLGGVWGSVWTEVRSFTQPKASRVIYEGNGSTDGAVPENTTWYLPGASVTVAAVGTLVRDGFAFSGWNTAADGSGTSRAAGSSFTIGSANVVLYAKWAPTYTVSYDGNGNTGGTAPVDAARYVSGASVTVAAAGTLERDGFAFSGWNTAADGSGTNRAAASSFAMGSANVVLYAKWAPTYTVTYNGNGNTGGTVPVDAARYVTGVSVTVGMPGSLVRDGYSFSGWNTAADGSGTSRAAGSSFTMLSSNVVLYAKWTALPTFSVTYNGNGHTGGTVPVDSTLYWTGRNVTVADNTGLLVKTGYAFAGWNTLASGTGTDRTAGLDFAMGSANVVLYAKWAPTYTVTYNGNGNTGGTVPVDAARYVTGASVTVGMPGSLVRDGYSFSGWNTAVDGSGTSRAAASSFTMLSSNVVLYAKWTALPTFTVTYNGNGHTGGTVPVDSTLYWTGRNVTVADNTGLLVKTGYAFAGWNTLASGTGTDRTAGLDFAMGSANVVLYAKWVPTYTVTYSGNGNTGGIVPVDGNRYLAGASVTVAENTGSLEKTGYDFAQWNTASDGSGTDLRAYSTFAMGSGNVVIYAKWASLNITMVAVPGGSFQMGSPSGGEGDTERPVHLVTLTGFQMGKYEVTQAQYGAVTMYNPSSYTLYRSGLTRPVEQVTWYDAVEFCNKLSIRDGFQSVYTITGRTPTSGYPITYATVAVNMTQNGYRLPTEAEWEYAARGGNGSPNNYLYSGSNDVETVAWYYTNSGSTTHTVGIKAANGLGLYDMSGNVYEWCQDWYGSYGSDPQSDPTGAAPSGLGYVIRGGGWNGGAYNCRSADRYFHGFGTDSGLGFRVVRRP